MREEIYNFGNENDTCYDEYGNIIPCPTNGGNQFDIPEEWIKDQSFATSLTPKKGEWSGGTMVVDEPQKDVQKLNLYPHSLSSTYTVKENQTFLEQNYSTIGTYQKDKIDKEYSFVNTIFSVAGQLPKINGSPINMSDLSKYMNNEASHKEIMSQAQSLLELPEVQLSDNAYNKIYEPYIESIMLDAQIGNGYNIINKDLVYSAERQDAKVGADDGYNGKVFTFDIGNGRSYDVVTDKGLHSRMFGKNGQLISKDEYNKFLEKREKDIVNSFADAYPLWQWKEQGRSEGLWGIMVDKIRDKVRAENEELSYDNNLERILEQYNNPELSKGVDKINILGKGNNIFREETGNLGGGIQAVPQEISFNLSKKGRMDENKQTKPETEEFMDMFEMAVENLDSILIGKGNVNTAKGRLPGEESFFQTSNDFSDTGKKLIVKIYDDVIAKEKDGKDLPYGKIQFQDIVAKDQKYHAYTITFNKEFLNDYAGTKDAPGLIHDDFKDLNADGFTIYVPADVSEKSTRFGQTSKNYKINANSGINAILSTVGEYNINIPNAGSLRMVKDKEKNIITINGIKQILNSHTLNYEEQKITDQVIENANISDVFGIYQSILDELKYGFYSNNMVRDNMLKAQNLK